MNKRLTTGKPARKYLHTIFIAVSVVISLAVIAYSVSIYYSVENLVLAREYQRDQTNMLQLKYNIENILDIASKICLGLYYDIDAQTVMHANSEDNLAGFINRMENLNKVTITNNFIHSIAIYNNNIAKYYYSYQSLFFQDVGLLELINSYERLPRLVFLPRTLVPNYTADKSNPIHILSVFMYENLDELNRMDGGLILNVEMKWLFKNIAMLEHMSEEGKESIYILSESGRIIGEKPKNAETDGDLAAFLQKRPDFFNAAGTVQHRIELDNNSYIVTLAPISGTTILILKLHSLDSFYGPINHIKLFIMLFSIAFLLMSFFLSLLASRIIYRPIGNLVATIRGSTLIPFGDEYSSEIDLIDQMYRSSLRQIAHYKQEEMVSTPIIKKYYLRNILTDSTALSREEYLDIRKKGSDLDLDRTIVICILKALRLKNTKSNGSTVFRSKVVEMCRSSVSRQHSSEIIDLDDSTFICLVNVEETNTATPNRLHDGIRSLQSRIRNRYGINSVVSVTDPILDKTQISKHFRKAQHNLDYYYIWGKNALITPARVQHHIMRSRRLDSLPFEERLIEEIKYGKDETIDELVDQIVDEIKAQTVENIKLSVIQLSHTVLKTLSSVNSMRLEPQALDITEVKRTVTECLTLEDVKIYIKHVIDRFTSGKSSQTIEKHIILTEAVKEIVNNNFQDSGLYLQGIADSLKVSPAHMGRIFRAVAQIGVSDYINEVRMEKAREYLEKTNMTINEIMIRVGIENKSYFYRSFKKRFGTTPKEYSMKKAFEKS